MENRAEQTVAEPVKSADKEWSRRLFNSLTINGKWAVPRSGLIFRKVDRATLALDEVMPWTKELATAAAALKDVPPTKEKLLEYQAFDYRAIALRFEAEGIKMPDPKGLLT